MSTITTIASSDYPSDSRAVINTNFSNLNTDKAELASPTFTGTPTLPTGTIAVTQSASNNSTKVATTAYVDNQVTTLGGAPSFSTTQVFSGTSPSTFTDLDLSSVVGARQRMVVLKFITSAGAKLVVFRPNGDATDYYGGATVTGANAGTNGATSSATTCIVKTDTAGVVEWRTTNAETGCTISVEAYW